MCFIVDLPMQHEFCYVNLIGRSWKTNKRNRLTPTTLDSPFPASNLNFRLGNTTPVNLCQVIFGHGSLRGCWLNVIWQEPIAGLGKNRRLVIDEPVELEKWPVEVQDFRKSPIILEESVEYTSNEWQQQNRKMSTCNRLDLESLGFWPTLYAQKLFPGTSDRADFWA